jgi:hypothetical protein
MEMKMDDKDKKYALIVKKNDQYSVGCQTKVAKDCLENGDFCDSEEEAHEWVEDECWIYSGEGWICLKCNEHFMENLVRTRKVKGLDGKDKDENLVVGIDVLRT